MSNLFSLESKVAVVTGAARGNGQAIAKGLREHGAQVIGLDIIEDKKCIRCDITSPEDIDRCLGKYFHIDVLVNNAGVQRMRGRILMK